MNKRYVIYPIVTCFAIGLILLPQVLVSPQRNIRNAYHALCSNAGQSYQGFSSYFKPYPNKGYILVLYTGKSPGFDTTEYVTISKLKLKGQKTRLVIDLITGPGQDNVKQLLNEEAETYLSMHNISLEDLDAKIFNN